jgi:hypothetical protein
MSTLSLSKSSSELTEARLRVAMKFGKVTSHESSTVVVLEKALRLLVGTRDWRGRALILLCQAEACLTLNLQEGAVACLTLAENSSSRIEDSTLCQDIEQRIKLVIAQVGEQQFLEFRKHLAGQAEIIRGQAMSRIAGK